MPDNFGGLSSYTEVQYVESKKMLPLRQDLATVEQPS